MSYADAINLGEVVKKSISENEVAKTIGGFILAEHNNMTEDDLSQALYRLMSITAAWTATRVMAHTMSEEKLSEVVDAITDLMSLNGEEDN
jgi:hypothetical protein